MTLSRIEEIRQVASEWEFDKRIPAPRAAGLLKELLRRVDDLERGFPLPPDVAEKVAEANRLRKLFDDAGQGEHNVLALIDHYQRNSMEADERLREVRRLLEEHGCDCEREHHWWRLAAARRRGLGAGAVCLACRIGEAVGK